ncbi:MAG: winged helix-turn-helix transcriptional regulator [Chloracidobacterium sp.]|nr:winged helix-turn-helix transcriptional regulator [Chloracidobacterium sp.]
MANISHYCIQFDGFFLNPKERLLFKGEERVDLRGKDFDILVYLADRPNLFVTHDELLDGVWGPDTYIDDSNITVHIAKVRSALGGDGGYVETVHGRKGYRFVAQATRVPCPSTRPVDVPAWINPVAKSEFSVECHKFVPVFLGTNAYIDFEEATSESLWSEHKILEKEEGGLYVLPAGVGVWHISHDLDFTTLTDLATWRRNTYREINEDRHVITTSTSKIISMLPQDADDPLASARGKIGYVLSVMILNAPMWEEPSRLRTAIKLLSCLTPLQSEEGDEQAREDAIRLENELLETGFAHKDVVEFGLSGSDLGFASWAGVSYYKFSGQPSRLRERIIEFEIAVQGLWWYTSCIKKICLSAPLTPKSKRKLSALVGAVTRQMGRLKTIGATEVSSQRTMCEAILATSRLESLVDDTVKLFNQI